MKILLYLALTYIVSIIISALYYYPDWREKAEWDERTLGDFLGWCDYRSLFIFFPGFNTLMAAWSILVYFSLGIEKLLGLIGKIRIR